MLLLLMELDCGSPATKLIDFFEEMVHFLKIQKFEFSQSILFWGAIRSDGGNMFVMSPNKLNAVEYLEILNSYLFNAFSERFSR